MSAGLEGAIKVAGAGDKTFTSKHIMFGVKIVRTRRGIQWRDRLLEGLLGSRFGGFLGDIFFDSHDVVLNWISLALVTATRCGVSPRLSTPILDKVRCRNPAFLPLISQPSTIRHIPKASPILEHFFKLVITIHRRQTDTHLDRTFHEVFQTGLAFAIGMGRDTLPIRFPIVNFTPRIEHVIAAITFALPKVAISTSPNVTASLAPLDVANPSANV